MGKVIVRCAGIVRKDDKLLLVKSKYEGSIYWIFPGGGLEPGESMEECVKREVKEETGININVKKMIFINENVSKENPMIHFTYLCEPLDDNLTIGSDPDHEERVVRDVSYIPFEEIKKLENFIPSEMKPALIQAMNTNFSGGPVIF